MGLVNREGWYYITGTAIQSQTGQHNSLTDNWSLYVGSRISSEDSLEHQLASEQPKNTFKNNLEREIDASISAIKTKKKEIDVHDEKELKTDETITDVFPPLLYNFHHDEFLAGLHYNVPALDYETLGYGGHMAVITGYDAEQDYKAQIPDDAESDMLTTQKAEEIFMKKQFHALLGNMYEGNAEDRRKLYLWITFNPSLFKLFESLHGLTRDVNYTMN